MRPFFCMNLFSCHFALLESFFSLHFLPHQLAHAYIHNYAYYGFPLWHLYIYIVGKGEAAREQKRKNKKTKTQKKRERGGVLSSQNEKINKSVVDLLKLSWKIKFGIYRRFLSLSRNFSLMCNYLSFFVSNRSVFSRQCNENNSSFHSVFQSN